MNNHPYLIGFSINLDSIKIVTEPHKNKLEARAELANQGINYQLGKLGKDEGPRIYIGVNKQKETPIIEIEKNSEVDQYLILGFKNVNNYMKELGLDLENISIPGLNNFSSTANF